MAVAAACMGPVQGEGTETGTGTVKDQREEVVAGIGTGTEIGETGTGARTGAATEEEREGDLGREIGGRERERGSQRAGNPFERNRGREGVRWRVTVVHFHLLRSAAIVSYRLHWTLFCTILILYC